MSLLIKNARHLDAPVDLLVRHGKIVTMTPAGHHTYDSREVFHAQLHRCPRAPARTRL